MTSIKENIKAFFSTKDKGESAGDAPKGMCPVCWGRSEWEGEYYEIIRDKHLNPEGDIYESFISKIADRHVNGTHTHGTEYICSTCNKKIA